LISPGRGYFKENFSVNFPLAKWLRFLLMALVGLQKNCTPCLVLYFFSKPHDLTDEETVNQVAFNILWHYALNITEESDSAKYICPKTLWNRRSIVVDNALDGILFEHITDKLAKV
jgi:hypothetical protein